LQGSQYPPSAPGVRRDSVSTSSDCRAAGRERPAVGPGLRQSRQHRATTRAAASSRQLTSPTSRRGSHMPPTAPAAQAARGYQKHLDKPGSPPMQVTQPDKPRHLKVRFVPTASKRGGTTGSRQKSKTPFQGSVPFDEISYANRCALACLTSTIRPQGFPPSRRFNPGVTSRLCFAPLPPVGFLGLESFSPPQQPRDFRRVTLVNRGTVRRAPASRNAQLRETSTHRPASKPARQRETQHTGPGHQSNAPAGRPTLPTTPRRGGKPPLL